MKFEEQLKRWCCSEKPLLFKERWDKHFSDVLDDNNLTYGDDCWNVDLSRIGDLYDSIRYDAIHHRQFLIQMFVGFKGEGEDSTDKVDCTDNAVNTISTDNNVSTSNNLNTSNNCTYEDNYKSLVKLFDDLHKLFRMITPLEYGFTRGERLPYKQTNIRQFACKSS